MTAPGILHLEGRTVENTCLDLSFTPPWRPGAPPEAWVTVEGFSYSPSPDQLLQTAKWLLSAYLYVTTEKPPRELAKPFDTALAVAFAETAVEAALEGFRC